MMIRAEFSGLFPWRLFCNYCHNGRKNEKKNVRISIESDKIQKLDFVFIPDGVIRGSVTAPMKPEDQTVGMPDYSFRSVDSKINIQSITLKGNGIHRTLQPTRGKYINGYDWLISRADINYNTLFAFFGLPAGDYKLTIKAEGYKTIVQEYSVTPGKPEYFRSTELTPN